MRTLILLRNLKIRVKSVGMKPLSERDENFTTGNVHPSISIEVGMKPLSERDENFLNLGSKNIE